ncbi:MAG: bifunctional diaminohydroxyphosphoribosylaminopyrimidine deaminase/5-amino-6-(5-phosphoribosylamino)uracil reductase RibD [Pseudomonadota bacterium]
MSISPSDRLFLRQAIELAERGRFTCAPNPCVGCVIVRDGEVIGRGYHQRAGQGHAEVNAMADAQHKGHDITGATVYVSLEPCAFVGRTPACANTLVEAGVARVVSALTDPHPQVAGSGLDLLRNAGVEVVETQDLDAANLITGYVKRVTQGLPWVRIKTATSLDGGIAMASGESQWITGPEARQDVQYWRARSDAIITGIGTVLEDNPSLTVRDPELLPFDQPLRVVLDRQLRTPADATLVQDEYATLLVHDAATVVPDGLSQGTNLQFLAVEHEHGDGSEQTLDVLLRYLAQNDCNEVLVEAGAGVVGSFVAADMWDEWLSYLAPKWLGRSSQRVVGFDPDQLADAPYGRIVDTQQLGDDLRLTIVAEREMSKESSQ